MTPLARPHPIVPVYLTPRGWVNLFDLTVADVIAIAPTLRAGDVKRLDGPQRRAAIADLFARIMRPRPARRRPVQ